MYRTLGPLPQKGPSAPLDLPQRRATVIEGTTRQDTGELNGHAKLNGNFDHHSKLRPTSLHAGMLATTSSSSSDLLTPTPEVPMSADPSSPGMTTTSQTMTSFPLSSAALAAGQGSAGAGSNWKKATRKLSLTGTMLGFSKKEKRKDKLGAIP